MSWFNRFRRGDARATTAAAPQAVCPHVLLVPRWDRAEDMGREDRATAFRCDACKTSFTPAEAEQLRRTEAERLRQKLA